MTFDKKELIKLFQNNLNDKIKALTEEALAQRDAATNEESKAENKYDTRGLEASYIAQAYASRIKEMQEGLYFLNKTLVSPYNNKIKVGDVVEICNVEKNIDKVKLQYFFILPTGGIELIYNGAKIRSLSVTSPLGKKLLGLINGDELRLNKKTLEITKVY